MCNIFRNTERGIKPSPLFISPPESWSDKGKLPISPNKYEQIRFEIV